MHVTVISPERSLFDGEARAVRAPAYDGEVGILPRHAAFLTMLGSGTLTITTAAGASRFVVTGGFLQVLEDVVRVVAERAEPSPATVQSTFQEGVRV